MRIYSIRKIKPFYCNIDLITIKNGKRYTSTLFYNRKTYHAYELIERLLKEHNVKSYSKRISTDVGVKNLWFPLVYVTEE